MWFWFPPSASTRFGNAWSAATHSARRVLGLIIWALPRDQRQLDHAVRIRLAHGTHYELRSPGCDPIAGLGVGGQVGGVNGDLFRARGRSGFAAFPNMADRSDGQRVAHREPALYGLIHHRLAKRVLHGSIHASGDGGPIGHIRLRNGAARRPPQAATQRWTCPNSA